MKVVYKPVHRFREESGLITVSVVYTYRQVTEITNNRKESATILFTDHIPLSRDDKLKVLLVTCMSELTVTKTTFSKAL